MIVEGKKLTAFDAMEAAIRLSETYRANRAKEFVTFHFHGHTEAFEVDFGKFESYECEIIKSFHVYLNELTCGDTFSDVFDMIEKELDRMAELEKEEFKA